MPILLLALTLPACQAARGPVEPITIDPAELHTFADGFFPEAMVAFQIPGLVFVLVQGGDVVYAASHGDANLASAIPMDAEDTVVAIGSVSKPFVATAVMQLSEQGKLDLDADINQYLASFQIAETYRRPVTLAHLLTHTAGFEDPPYVLDSGPEDLEPLDPFLAANMPPRTHPPGKAHIYSNYGYALAALVVEEVSGLPFHAYVEEHIFEPLGMHRTSYLIAPPPPESMATGYTYDSGDQIPLPADYHSTYPAGAIVTTAEDMSHFLLAQLGDGCYRGVCILQADTLAQMHRRQAGTGYEGQNVTYGFVEASRGRLQLIGHSGATRGFGSDMVLVPEQNLGYFLAFNEECYETVACQIVSGFRDAFLHRFF